MKLVNLYEAGEYGIIYSAFLGLYDQNHGEEEDYVREKQERQGTG